MNSRTKEQKPKRTRHKHEPDWTNMMIARDCIEPASDGSVYFIVDVPCKTCGTSGSFGISVVLDEINW